MYVEEVCGACFESEITSLRASLAQLGQQPSIIRQYNPLIHPNPAFSLIPVHWTWDVRVK